MDMHSMSPIVISYLSLQKIQRMKYQAKLKRLLMDLGKLNTYSKLYDNDYNFLFKSIENINKEILDNAKNVIKYKLNEIDKKIIKNNHVIKYSDCDFLFKIVTANIQVTIVNETKNIINSYFKLINQFKKTNRDYYFLLNIIEYY